MFRFIFLISILFFSIIPANSQVDFIEKEEELAYLADVMVNTTESKHRLKAAILFEDQFITALNTPGSFSHSFESLKWISQLSPDNNDFRIFSWIIADEEMVSTTYGYIQFSNGKVVKLNDNAEMSTDLEFEVTDSENWFGAIYYQIMPFTKSGKTDYILFGYRQLAKFDKVKVLDVLSLEEGEITFGKELFVKKIEGSRNEIKTRLLLTYSADANVTLNYNANMDMIVHDHLISRMGRIEGQGPTQLPDGSYVGYKQEIGNWIYVDKIFNHISATAPRPQPVLGADNDTNIFGRKKTTKKKKRN